MIEAIKKNYPELANVPDSEFLVPFEDYPEFVVVGDDSDQLLMAEFIDGVFYRVVSPLMPFFGIQGSYLEDPENIPVFLEALKMDAGNFFSVYGTLPDYDMGLGKSETNHTGYKLSDLYFEEV